MIRTQRFYLSLVMLPIFLAVVSGPARAQAIIDAVRRNDFPAVRELVQSDPRNISATDRDGATPLHWAANYGNPDMIRLLLRSGAGVNKRQDNGWAPIHSASVADRVEAIRELLRQGADIDARTRDGNAAIHFAARYGGRATVCLLLAEGADIDTPNADGNTPLAVAAWYGQMEVVRLLISAGADVRIKNKFEKTALDEANRAGKSDIAKVLSDYQQGLEERAAREIARMGAGLNLRTGYAAWSDPKMVTKTVYNADFKAASPGPEWTVSGANAGTLTISTTPVGGRRFLGEFGNHSVLLNLPQLPEHSEIAISFDLFILRTMDGNDSRNDGPDIWSLSIVDGPTLTQTTFSNGNIDTDPRVKFQAYPGEYPGDHHEPYSGATEKNSLGYTVRIKDQDVPMSAVYQLRFTISHANRAILFRFAGTNMQSLDDESWGIANVRVAVGVMPEAARPVVPPSPFPHSGGNLTTRRTAPVHKPVAKPAARIAVRKPKPVAKARSNTAVKRIHDKKQAPKP